MNSVGVVNPASCSWLKLGTGITTTLAFDTVLKSVRKLALFAKSQ